MIPPATGCVRPSRDTLKSVNPASAMDAGEKMKPATLITGVEK
ncbi:hypothetical protein HRbin01_00015 [archaeon HR01]|nr:hypothetical protein HRbin01_00015 [archaeon HR01]